MTTTGSKFASVLSNVKHLSQDQEKVSKIKIENCIGFVQVPVGIAGPLYIQGSEATNDNLYAPLATVEPTLVASCARGCKALNLSGGAHFEVLGEGMSRAPAFTFPSPREAAAFARRVPGLQNQFARDAESTSRYVRLQKLTPHIIGSSVHVHFSYSCGDAAGQNMVTIATQKACDSFLNSTLAGEMQVRGFIIEGQMASDKKPSWGNVKEPRGVEVIAWGVLSNSVCLEVLGCSSKRLYDAQMTLKDGGIRNGQFGCNINTANILAAIFIATGQDAGSVAEGSWSQLTSEYDDETMELRVSLYFPSLPVGSIGGGTSYDGQSEALQMLRCAGPGMKRRLAGVIASFAIALDVSTSAALANNTFTQSHQRLARGGKSSHTESKLGDPAMCWALL